MGHKIKSGDKLEIKYRTPYEQQCLITDLVAELAIVLNDKAKLENENSRLKLQCQELKQKFLDFERGVKNEKQILIEDIKKSEEKIKEKEIILAKKDAEFLENQNKCITEVSDIKTVYYKHKDYFQKRELELTNQIKKLNMALLKAITECESIKELIHVNKNKYDVYKAKLKFAIDLIKKLTAEVKTKSQLKISTVNKKSQTEIDNSYNSKSNHRCLSSTLQNCYNTKYEDNILNELFFKANFSSVDDNIFFAVSDTIENNNLRSLI